jgi:nucleoid-associated protein YgaU
VDWERILTTGEVPPEVRIPLAAVPPGNTGPSRAETDVFGEPQREATPEINWHSAGTTPPGSPVGSTPAPAAPAAPKSTPREHVVQQGEHLSSISLAIYGDARHYREILKANPGLDERKLKPGTKIKLPDPSTFTSGRAQQAIARLEPSIDPTKEYRVAPGDSLHKIAVKLYGKPARADELYELNRARIGDDSSRVKVGMVLNLPEPPTAPGAQSSR